MKPIPKAYIVVSTYHIDLNVLLNVQAMDFGDFVISCTLHQPWTLVPAIQRNGDSQALEGTIVEIVVEI